MSPPVETFPASQLLTHIEVTAQNTRRKDKIELEKCELLEMLQYECALKLAEGEVPRKETPVICRPVERLFRRCKDRKGSFVVETTAWEGKKGA